MSLLRLQRELAALLMEEPARRAFAAGKQRYARQRGLRGKEARLLASLDAGDVGYFASRRQLDRRSALRVDMTRTTALLEERDLLLRYFRAVPYALEDPVKEAKRVASWAVKAARKGHIPGLAADLARYEAADLALRARPHKAAKPSRHPRRAPGIVLLRLGHDIAPALEGGTFDVEARRCHVLVWRGPEEVKAGEMPAVVAHILRLADGKRPEARLVTAASRAAGLPPGPAKRALAELRAEGLVSLRRQA